MQIREHTHDTRCAYFNVTKTQQKFVKTAQKMIKNMPSIFSNILMQNNLVNIFKKCNGKN